MILSIAEKVLLTQSLPVSGSLSFMRTMRDVRAKVYHNKEEIRKLITRGGQGISEEVVEELSNKVEEIEFTERETQAIQELLSQMSEEGKITEAHVDLCEKFGVV